MALSKISIHVDIPSLEMNNNITGRIFFSINNEELFFPEKDWDDFLVIILSWWHNSLRRLKNSQREIMEEFNFMDGPFLVRGIKTSEDIIKLSFIQDENNSEKIELTCHVSIKQFEKTLKAATGLLLKELKMRNWHSEDIEELEKAWELLKI